MSIIDQIREGDLVEAVKGETVIRGRVKNNYGSIVVGAGWTLLGLRDSGFTLTVVEKAAPPPPTEPGHYLDRDGDHLELPANGTLSPDFAPFTRLEPVPDTVKRVADYLRERGRRLAADDVEEHFGVTS